MPDQVIGSVFGPRNIWYSFSFWCVGYKNQGQVGIHYNDVIMSAMASQITGVSIVYLLNRLFRRRSKETWKFRATGLCEGNPPVTGGFSSQRASNAETVFIWWHHHDIAVNVGVACKINNKWYRSILMCILEHQSGYHTYVKRTILRS